MHAAMYSPVYVPLRQERFSEKECLVTCMNGT